MVTETAYPQLLVTFYLLVTHSLCTGRLRHRSDGRERGVSRAETSSDAMRASPSFLQAVVSHKNPGRPAVAAAPVFVNVFSVPQHANRSAKMT